MLLQAFSPVTCWLVTWVPSSFPQAGRESRGRDCSVGWDLFRGTGAEGLVGSGHYFSTCAAETSPRHFFLLTDTGINMKCFELCCISNQSITLPSHYSLHT